MTKKNKNFLIWITGLSGSGKSTLGKIIYKDIKKKYENTILMNGDDIRNIFKIKTYTKKDRLILGKQYIKLCKFLTRQNVNIIFTVVGLFSELHKLNRKNFSKYIEIYIKSDLKILKKSKVRKFYCNNSKNVWGFDIKPEFPTDPHITLKNNDMSSLLKKKNDILKKIYHNLDD